MLTDVAVVHWLGYDSRRFPCNPTTAAKHAQCAKRLKYAAIASRHDAQLIPFVVEICGGLASNAVQLLNLISGACWNTAVSSTQR